MNIPDKVKIGYKDYEVKKIDGDVLDNNTICYGRILYDECKIEISTKYSNDVQQCVLIHEILHGIDDVYDIGLQEEHISKLAKALLQVIKDNGGVKC